MNLCFISVSPLHDIKKIFTKTLVSTKEIAMKKTAMLTVFLLLMSPAAGAFAEDKPAKPQDAYDMVLKASYVLENLGEEGLKAFGQKDGEFWKGDLYITVWNCSEKRMVFHINPKLIEMGDKAWDLQGKMGV